MNLNPFVLSGWKVNKLKVHTKKVKEIRTTRPLDIIHMDLMGPMHIESREGKKYVLVVIDYFSRYSFMRFLREKSETIEHLRSLFNRIQVEIGPICTDYEW